MQILEEWSLQEGQRMYLPTHWKSRVPQRRQAALREVDQEARVAREKMASPRESRDPNSKGSQGSKGSKGSKGSDRRKGPKPPKVPAAVCILGALIAATSSTQADAAYACRKGSPGGCYDRSSTFSCALPVIRFDDDPMLIGIPPEGKNAAYLS